jgi:hypothetical protein
VISWSVNLNVNFEKLANYVVPMSREVCSKVWDMLGKSVIFIVSFDLVSPKSLIIY